MNSPDQIRINEIGYSHQNYRQLLNTTGNEPWVQAIIDFLNEWYNNSDFIEVQTSGSTGAPKTIRLSKQSMINSAVMTCRFFGLDTESNALLCLPADYIAGKMMIVRAFVSGMNLTAVRPSANPFENINEIIDFAAITPYQFVNSYQTIQETAIRKIIVGGSQVSLRLEKMMEDLDTDIYETYGMTETCSHIALRKLNGKDKSEYFQILEGIEIRTDQRNCLIIKAPSLTKEELITNDVVELKDAKRFKWQGRFDNVINSGGIKVFPEQIEKKIEPFIDRRFFVGAVPDEDLHQKVALIIEGKPLSDTESDALRKNMDKVLSKYEKPKEIYFREDFELSSAGKILKSKILSSIKTVY